MSIDWAHFTPYASLAGGVTIGIAAALLLLFNGRIAGISGILGGLLRTHEGDRLWRIDLRLLAGSAAFGIGWGLAGFCPGPALVALGAGETKAVVFTAAMLAGMGIYELLRWRERASSPRTAAAMDA